MSEEKEKSIAQETMSICKILYCQRDLPMTKTCMCWGWECGEGWYDVLRDLSCSLEAINLMYYDKYKVRIQADQVKEKFGTLRFYYSVVCDNYTEEGLEAKETVDSFEKKKDSGYFGIKTIVDEKGHYEDVDKDGTGTKTQIWCPPITHIEVTTHKDEYDRMSAEAEAALRVLWGKGRYALTDEQKVIMVYMESEADRLIKEAEGACYNTCEICGEQIGSDDSPRIQTKGWIRFICKKCSDNLEKQRERKLKENEENEENNKKEDNDV